MNYLSAESLTKSYGIKVLFESISFGINKGQKIALIAKNGTGKTSLLRILTGVDMPDKGNVTLRKEITIAYLEQDPQLNPTDTIIDAVLTADVPIVNAIKEYERCVENASLNDSNETGNQLHRASEKMDLLQAWDYETKIKQILSLLKIDHLNRPVSSLSGGQRKRVALSKVLISNPDLLIMDEPTNHLDIEMTEWLENYLIGKDTTLLLVTHDRYFMDRVCNEIIELDGGKLYHYKGNYSYFLEKKAEREQKEGSEMEKTRNLYRRELEWIRRMPKARTTKSKSRENAFYDIEEKAKQKRKEETLQLSVKMTRMGGKILELIKLSKAYGNQHVLRSFSYTFKRNEKIGIVGKNGIGKTTLLNIITENEPFDSGKIQTGETVVFGYYSQNGLILNEDKRVIEVVKEVADFIPLANGSKLSASQLLQRFMFDPDVQYTFVSKLSGGEKRRLYLLTVLMKNPNFLILDEPTNDLDILTLNALEEFLRSFQGCVLIVTHDRYFMDKLVDHLFVFEGDGIVKDFPGNYSDYRQHAIKKEKQERKADVPVKEETTVEEKLTDQPAPVAKRKLSFKEKFEYEQLEKEIEQLEAEKIMLTEKLNSANGHYEELRKSTEAFNIVIKKLEERTIRWLELAELI